MCLRLGDIIMRLDMYTLVVVATMTVTTQTRQHIAQMIRKDCMLQIVVPFAARAGADA